MNGFIIISLAWEITLIPLMYHVSSMLLADVEQFKLIVSFTLYLSRIPVITGTSLLLICANSVIQTVFSQVTQKESQIEHTTGVPL